MSGNVWRPFVPMKFCENAPNHFMRDHDANIQKLVSGRYYAFM